MRLLLELCSENEFVIPIHYNYLIQSFIYSAISPELAEILHDYGFPLEKRRFKLFTFSRILGKYKINKDNGNIAFTSPFKIIVSSVIKDLIEEIAEELLRKENLKIASQEIHTNSIEVSDLPIEQDKLKIKMLSPITIYSTLSRADGKKKTYYYTPFEKEFSELISENAKKKFRAFYHKRANGEIQLTPLKVNTGNQKIISYKGTIVKGWMGIYELSGDPELMKLTYDTGLGGKNPQGFGCFEIVKNRNISGEVKR